MNQKVVPVNAVPDTPEFRLETEYASRSALLLDEQLERIGVDEESYLSGLEKSIEALGMPPNHESIVIDREIYQHHFDKYIVGQFAGSVFGKDGSHKTRLAWYFHSRPGLHLVDAAKALAPRALKPRLESLAKLARGLQREPGSPYGHAGQHCVYSDLPLATAVFGPERVRARLEERIDYALRRIELSAPRDDRFLRHLELDQWIEIFSDQMLPNRHLATAHGKTVVAPYAAGPLLSCALKVPVAQRYLRGFEAKYLLKEVLRKRLPSYPTSQRKLATALPFRRYYESGPLARVWERYAVPDFFEGEARARVVEQPSWMTWNAITYAIWEDRVAKNPDLAPIPSSRRWDWGGGAGSPIPVSRASAC